MRETSISINKHIYQLLINDEILNGLVDKKIFPLVAEESVTFPFIVFHKDSSSGQYTKDLLSYDEATFTVNIAASNYFQTVDIAERVRQILENTRNNYFHNILLDSVTEDYVEDTYIQQLQFSAKIYITYTAESNDDSDTQD